MAPGCALSPPLAVVVQHIVYFEADESVDVKAREYIEQRLKELGKPGLSGKYSVILHNDPINGVDYVTRVITEVFGYGTARAFWLMLKAHVTGKSTLWVGPKDEAASYQRKLIGKGPDPNMVHRGAEPLTVTIEKLS